MTQPDMWLVFPVEKPSSKEGWYFFDHGFELQGPFLSERDAQAASSADYLYHHGGLELTPAKDTNNSAQGEVVSNTNNSVSPFVPFIVLGSWYFVDDQGVMKGPFGSMKELRHEQALAALAQPVDLDDEVAYTTNRNDEDAFMDGSMYLYEFGEGKLGIARAVFEDRDKFGVVVMRLNGTEEKDDDDGRFLTPSRSYDAQYGDITLLFRTAQQADNVYRALAPTADQPPAPKQKPCLEEQLINLLNMNSCENESNTADYILAKFLLRSLETWNECTNIRDMYNDARRIDGER